MNPSKCTLCFKMHTNQWHDGPNMYCEACVPIREAARNTFDNVHGSLYLGDMKGASRFDGYRMCVHELGAMYEGQCDQKSILTTVPNSKWDRTGAIASIDILNEASDVIEDHVSRNEKILVHCMGGVERSPLTIVWWLMKTKRYNNVDRAYQYLQLSRPVVSERLFWLPSDHELYRDQP